MSYRYAPSARSMISGSAASQSASAVNGCQRWALSQRRSCAAEASDMKAIPDRSRSWLPAEPDRSPLPHAKPVGRTAVDDRNLDLARAADQADQGAGGRFAVGAPQPRDPRAGHIDDPLPGRDALE